MVSTSAHETRLRRHRDGITVPSLHIRARRHVTAVGHGVVYDRHRGNDDAEHRVHGLHHCSRHMSDRVDRHHADTACLPTHSLHEGSCTANTTFTRFLVIRLSLI